MKQPKIIVAGIGPGSEADITGAVLNALREADVVVGYKYYFQFVKPFLQEGAQCVDTGMKKERERAEQAFNLAEEGKTVVGKDGSRNQFWRCRHLWYDSTHL